jgi:hypothetical protein
MDVPVAANILGIAGAICWSVQVGHNQLPKVALIVVAVDPTDHYQLPTT